MKNKRVKEQSTCWMDLNRILRGLKRNFIPNKYSNGKQDALQHNYSHHANKKQNKLEYDQCYIFAQILYISN